MDMTQTEVRKGTTSKGEAFAPDLAPPEPESLAAQGAGAACVLCALPNDGRLGQRLADMGFCPGIALRVVRRAPLGDPLEVDLDGSRICIRAAEAALVLVRPLAQRAAERREPRP